MILKGLSPEFIQSLNLEQRMALAGEKGVNGRFLQEEGEVDIVCLTDPIQILDTYAVNVSVSFYSNNEPHIHFDEIKKMSSSVMKDIISGMRDVLKKFDEMGYDKVFTLNKKGDVKRNKISTIVGFKPIVYYKAQVGTEYIKYEMSTH